MKTFTKINNAKQIDKANGITSSVKLCRDSGSYRWEVFHNGIKVRVGFCTSKERAERHAAESIGSMLLF